LKNRLRAIRTWLQTLPLRQKIQIAPKTAGVKTYYGYPDMPKPGEHAWGGIVKFQHLLPHYPNSPEAFNVLCLVSSRPPKGAHLLAKTAQKKGARLIWNQNGVSYPAVQPDWETRNASMKKLLHMAHHVFYQSEFCRMCANKYLGERSGSGEVLYNAVDTATFTPTTSLPDRLTLLLGGTQYQYYRFETAIRTLLHIKEKYPDARLLVTGALCWHPDPSEARQQANHLISQTGLSGSVELYGPYTQQEAPSLFKRAHMLLHTKYNDPCPGLVVEAMASGLPVVYSHSGGVPELVGDHAGIGIPTELNWEHDLPPDPEQLAQAVLQIASNRSQYAEAARQRAVEKFDIKYWIKRYRDIFEALT
jgi:glycosyltransferase involved in cell wall biosynthesis